MAPSPGANAVICLPFLMSCSLTHFLIAELGCFASLQSALNQIFSGNSFSQSNFNSFSQTITLYSLLTVIPMLTYAIAYLRIRSVIKDEEGQGGHEF